MNTHKIGNDAENECRKALENQGFKVYKKIHTRWNPGDIFELFDIIAVNKDKMRLIQVKAAAIWPETREAMKKFEVPANVTKEIWLRRKNQDKNNFNMRWHIECY